MASRARNFSRRQLHPGARGSHELVPFRSLVERVAPHYSPTQLARIPKGSFPKSRVFCHHARGSQTCQDEPASAIEKSSFEQIHADEPCRRFEEYRSGRAPPPFRKILLRPPTAVSIELLEILIQRRICIVQEPTFDFASRTIGHIDVFVNEVGVVPQVAAEQTDRLVTAPTPVPYLFAEKEASPRHSERRVLAWIPHDPTNLGGKLRCAPLVGIEDEDPFALRPLDPFVTRRSDRRELRTDHRGAGAACPIDRVVSGIVLDYNHFARPLDAGDAGFDVRGFIVSRDHRRYVRGAAVGGHLYRRPRVRALLAARSKPSIISLSGNSLATLVRAALPIISRSSSLTSIPATVAAVEAESSGG